MRFTLSALALALAAACSDAPRSVYSDLDAAFDDPAEAFLEICLAPRILPDRISALAREGRWSRIESYTRDSRTRHPVNFRNVWLLGLGNRTARLSLEGVFLDKWFVWPMDNDIPGHDCKLEFSGGDATGLAQRLRAEGFREIGRPGGNVGIRYDEDCVAHPAEFYQLGGRGCVINFSYDTEEPNTENSYSRSISAYCSR
jgi:hypothetical protein